MPRPALVTSDDWPESELRAAVLAGELVPVGACWASPAEPQTPTLLAAAAAWVFRDTRLVAGTLTAAWIWGAVSRAPTPLEACIRPQIRVHVDAGIRLREVALDPADVTWLGGVAVTTPIRTAVDLLRRQSSGAGAGSGSSPAAGPGPVVAPGSVAGSGSHPFDRADAAAVHGLLAIGAVTVQDLRDRLAALGTIPMVRQAERRLRALS